MSDGSSGLPESQSPSPKASRLVPGSFMGENFSVEVATFSLVFEGVTLPMGLRLERAQVSGVGLSAQSSPWEGNIAQPAPFEVLVSQIDIETFLASKNPGGLREFSVSLDDGRINVAATLHVLIDMRASAICRLEILEQKRLMIVLESAGVLGVTTKNLIQSQIDHINPVFDAATLPVPVELKDVTIENGFIRVRGVMLPLVSA